MRRPSKLYALAALCVELGIWAAAFCLGLDARIQRQRLAHGEDDDACGDDDA